MLAIERLKLTVFYLKLFEQTSLLIPVMRTLDCDSILTVKDQKRDKDNYLASNDLKPELKPMSIDVQSAPTCFDKARVSLGGLWPAGMHRHSSNLGDSKQH